MKHDANILIALVMLFLVTQVAGLFLLSHDLEVRQAPDGSVEVVHEDTVVGPRPEVAGAEIFLTVIFSVFIGTGLLMLLIRFRKVGWWRIFFLLAVFLTISIALGVVIDPLLAVVLAIVLAVAKVSRPNVVLHNLTEILIYSGIAVLFAPIFELVWIVLLLVVISVYDMIAVWKSGHMITLAKSLSESKMFAGFSISYESKSGKGDKKPAGKAGATGEGAVTQAVLGGGDVAFPLIFSGVVMEMMIRTWGLTKEVALLKVMVIPAVVTAVLVLLFMFGKRGKFYPAMPFLTIGCLAGFGLLTLL